MKSTTERQVEIAIYIATFLVVLPRAMRWADKLDDLNTPDRAKHAVAYAGHYAKASAVALSALALEALK